ncbi:MAG: baseplate J/gp47 family protein [Bacteroidia bacterium]|nr:baseplate J/gp47 family protein [Bacteroidia bacterium]
MINNGRTINPLLRDGTSQPQRLLKSLLPSYVSVDERSMDDLLAFAAEFSKEINFFNPDNNTDGTWEKFFNNQTTDKVNQSTQPHYALFIAFLELFKIAQTDLNTITQRHLDFYYREVLNLRELEAVPDQVFVILGLAQNVASYLITGGTALNAKQDNLGLDLTYKTNRNTTINKAQIAELKALFYNKKNDGRLYASPIANSANGAGLEIEGTEKKWRTFGAINNPNLPFDAAQTDRSQASVGFAFSSPALLMAEGSRMVTLTIKVANLNGLTNDDISNAFVLQFSGENSWVLPLGKSTTSGIADNSILIKAEILSGQPAIVPYNKSVLGDNINTNFPVVKVLLNTNLKTSPFVYEKLKALSIKSALVHVSVSGIRNLFLQNDNSAVDNSKPFLPFGNRPNIGSNFYIGSHEAFSKKLSSFSVNIKWLSLPKSNKGFEDYYHNYIPRTSAGENLRKSENFKAELSVLTENNWVPLLNGTTEESRLFVSTGSVPGVLDENRSITVSGSIIESLGRDIDLSTQPAKNYDTTTSRGFIKLSLKGADFGHSDFQNSFSRQAIKAATPVTTNYLPQDINDTLSFDKTKWVRPSGETYLNNASLVQNPTGIYYYPLPNEPYSPTVSEISINYSTSAKLNLENNLKDVNNATAFNNRIEKFFHLEPFGVAERHPFISAQPGNLLLVPLFEDEGTLYMGISELEPPQTLSFLFKIAEGSSNPELLRQNLKWSVLINNEWINLTPSRVLADSTNGFLTSGIVVVDLPKTISNTNTLLTPGLHWLKASVTNDSLAVCDMIEIRTQAIAATFEDNQNDPNHLAESLPAGTISELSQGDSTIIKIEQPYASFGGRIKEQNENFYARVSERLRHKNRGATIWDYEHLVLQEFASIYKVKCLNHTRFVSGTDLRTVAPGNVSVVVVSNVKSNNSINPIKPKTGLILLDEIKLYLQKLIPPCVTLHVKNPIFEEIQLDFKVKIRAGFDTGYYTQKLNEDLVKFLAPWAYGGNDISFGGSIHKSVILNYVEDQEYVDFVTTFRMHHYSSSNILLDVNEATASTPASILTSSDTHKIYVLESDEIIPDDDNLVNAPFKPVNEVMGNGTPPPPPYTPPYGVGAFSVGVNFIVGNGLPFEDGGLGFKETDDGFSID